MRVLYVGNAQSVHLQRWIGAAVCAGFSVRVASFRPESCAAPVVLLHTRGLGKLGYLWTMGQLRREALSFRPEVVHAHYLTSYGAVSAMASLHPLIVTAWGSDLFRAPGTGPVHRWLARRAIAGADLVTVVADHMKREAIELGADDRRLETVVFGLDFDIFHPRVQEREHPVVRIVCTRGFAPVYRIDTLIAALGRLKRKERAFVCHLVGDGPLRAALVRQVRREDLHEEVRFLGMLDPRRVAAELCDADIFVSPSISDGNNVSLTEAMACGAFPIATDIAANRQWLEHGVTGLLYAPGDVDGLTRALGQAMDSAALRSQARSRNWDTVRTRARWDTQVSRMFELYERLAGEPR